MLRNESERARDEGKVGDFCSGFKEMQRDEAMDGKPHPLWQGFFMCQNVVEIRISWRGLVWIGTLS